MILQKYARLLVDYCLAIQPGELLYLKATTLAEPLVREVYRYALQKGAHVEVQLSFMEENRIFIENAGEQQLNWISPASGEMMQKADAYLYIRAPFNVFEDSGLPGDKIKQRQHALEPLNKIYFERTGNGRLKRCLCQYPTTAAAQQARMSLENYEQFVYRACKLDKDDPTKAWLELRETQQKIVDYLHTKDMIRYVSEGTDISFSTKGRTWLNSDGRSNMPSGEVFTAPVEDSVNGEIAFSFPSVYLGTEFEAVRLKVKNGLVVGFEAQKGAEKLEEILAIPGANRFGEAAIGTNYDINRYTGNILFDEKIGGTIHMALGQSYLQAGGKNESSIHWDLITEMKNGGKIYADGTLIYENGTFLI